MIKVPGNIFSQNSHGTHQFLKLGATPITCATDILYALCINPEQPQASMIHTTSADLTAEEQKVLELLREPTDKDTLIRKLQLQATSANVLLMQMEMKGYIVEDHNHYRRSQ